jgi:hypothetical protein
LSGEKRQRAELMIEKERRARLTQGRRRSHDAMERDMVVGWDSRNIFLLLRTMHTTHHPPPLPHLHLSPRCSSQVTRVCTASGSTESWKVRTKRKENFSSSARQKSNFHDLLSASDCSLKFFRYSAFNFSLCTEKELPTSLRPFVSSGFAISALSLALRRGDAELTAERNDNHNSRHRLVSTITTERSTANIP